MFNYVWIARTQQAALERLMRNRYGGDAEKKKRKKKRFLLAPPSPRYSFSERL